jgi:hypothetical protein
MIPLAMPVKSGSGGHFSPDFEELIPLKGAAKLSGLTHEHLRGLASQGEFWAKKIGRNWVTTKEAVQEYLARKNLNQSPKQNPAYSDIHGHCLNPSILDITPP